MASSHSLDDDHRRPEGASDDVVAATGKVSEALEWVERARGHLYEAHQLMGHADELFGEAADALDAAGAAPQADLLRLEVVGGTSSGVAGRSRWWRSSTTGTTPQSAPPRPASATS